MRKSNLQFVFILFAIAFLFSCNKGENYTVKGRIVEDCAGNIPVANTKFTFVSSYTPSMFSRKDNLKKIVKTDANGYFEFVYNSKKLTKNGIYIEGLFEIDRFTDYAAPIKSHQNYDLGDFPLKNSFSYKINLIVKNSYTASDTLFVVTEMKDTLAVIPGPFSNSIIGPYNNSLLADKFEYKDEVLYQQTFIRAFLYDHAYPSNTNPGYNLKQFRTRDLVKMCDNSEKTFDITID